MRVWRPRRRRYAVSLAQCGQALLGGHSPPGDLLQSLLRLGGHALRQPHVVLRPQRDLLGKGGPHGLVQVGTAHLVGDAAPSGRPAHAAVPVVAAVLRATHHHAVLRVAHHAAVEQYFSG
jgi:hypothetical protein